jgi:hypothetical protein
MIETMAGEHRQPRGAGLVVVTPAVSWRSRRRVVWSSQIIDFHMAFRFISFLSVR